MGTRLRPVSGDTAKPMVPFLGRPLMEYTVLLLREQGFTDICAAVKYRAESIIGTFGDGKKFGVNMTYRVEGSPLGTAGAVKNCADFVGDDDFLIISGDAVCDYDLASLMQARREADAAAAIALSAEAEPLRYGLAVTDGEGLIRAFIEKPDWPHVVTDLVNTGIYAASARLLDSIPAGRESDFGRDIFPGLLHRGEKLIGKPMEGYWCDIGTPASYYRCCADALEGRLKLPVGGEFTAASVSQSCDAAPPDGLFCDIPCGDRAGLMRAILSAGLPGVPDYENGLSLTGDGYTLHISPLSEKCAVRIRASASDTELASAMLSSAKDIVSALGKELGVSIVPGIFT